MHDICPQLSKENILHFCYPYQLGMCVNCYYWIQIRLFHEMA